MVKAFDAVAVTVVEPPKETLLPLIVTELLTKPALGKPVQLVKVPDAGVPSTGATSVLLLSVCVPDSVATVESMAIVTAVEPL